MTPCASGSQPPQLQQIRFHCLCSPLQALPPCPQQTQCISLHWTSPSVLPVPGWHTPPPTPHKHLQTPSLSNPTQALADSTKLRVRPSLQHPQRSPHPTPNPAAAASPKPQCSSQLTAGPPARGLRWAAGCRGPVDRRAVVDPSLRRVPDSDARHPPPSQRSGSCASCTAVLQTLPAGPCGGL